MKCQWDGCDKEATHHPKVCVPATNKYLPDHAPIPCVVSLQACEEHALQYNVTQFLDAETPNGKFKNRDVFILLARGRADPDFTRAYVEAIPIGQEDTAFVQPRQPEPDAANQSVPTGG